MQFLIPIVISVTFFAAVAVPIYEQIRSRHRERMALIEKGIVTEDVKYLYSSSSTINPYSYLKWGLILVFVGIGILMGFLNLYIFGQDPAIIFALIPIGAGVALLIFYRIALKKQKEGEVV